MNDALYMPGRYARELAQNINAVQAARLRGKSKHPKQGWDDLFLCRKPMTIDANGIATIQIFGPLGKCLDPIWKMFGSTDYDDLSKEIMDAKQNRAVRGVFVDVNSCGGQALGCPEVSEALFSLRGVKPTLTYTDTIMASAAYSIGCSSDTVWAAGSASLGSVGSIIDYYEYSGMLEQDGISPVTFQAGSLKNAGTSDRKPTPEEAAYIQGTIDEMNGVFRAHVLAARGEVADETMQGQCFSGRRAKGLNLIDEIGTRDEAYDELLYLVS